MLPLYFPESFVNVPDVAPRQQPRVCTSWQLTSSSMELDVRLNGAEGYGNRYPQNMRSFRNMRNAQCSKTKAFPAKPVSTKLGRVSSWPVLVVSVKKTLSNDSQLTIIGRSAFRLTRMIAAFGGAGVTTGRWRPIHRPTGDQ